MFLHGVGSDHSVWREQVEAFGGDRSAIAIDFVDKASLTYRTMSLIVRGSPRISKGSGRPER